MAIQDRSWPRIVGQGRTWPAMAGHGQSSTVIGSYSALLFVLIAFVSRTRIADETLAAPASNRGSDACCGGPVPQSTAADKCSRCYRAVDDSGRCSRTFLFTPFAYMCGRSFWKPEHMLSSNAVPLHFRSSPDSTRLHNVTGQVGATGHAAGARVRNVHVCEGVAEHAADT